MARIDVNTQDERYQGLIDEGQYELVCTDVEVRDVKSKPGETQLMWHFETEWNNKLVELVRFTPLAGKGVTFTREILDALRVSYEDNGSHLGFDTTDVVQARCLANVKNRIPDDGSRPTNDLSTFIRV